jgi:hypothetical protein
MIRGYPNPPSVLQGDKLRLHIAADAPVWFQVYFYRQGEQRVFKARTDAMLAQVRPLGPPDRDWNWPIYEHAIPSGWESGAYIAVFVPVERKDTHDLLDDPGHPEAAALFVVKNRRANVKILYKLPLLSYHAYNEIGEPCGSLYTGGYNKLTLHRPGGGVGGRPWDHYFPDYYDTSSFRQTFWHWDAPFIRWLEKRRIAVDYCTDLDIHKNFGNFLGAYRLLLSVGHDEYWSEGIRRNVETFIEKGGNVAFFSGNTCWWRVHLVEGHAAFVCHKTGTCSIDQEDQWFRFDPENRLTGVSHRNGGGQWWGEREAIGYTVQRADHWVFEGTGLRDGDTFGADHALVGYECDGTAISDRADERGFAVPRYDDGTPQNFVILGTGRLGHEWAQDPEGFPGERTATMGIYANNGIVFTAATTDWVRVLASGEAHVEKITENVLCRLGSGNLEHPGVRAWYELYRKRSGPNFIEVLREGRKSCIYRLDGMGPGGTAVIANRCRTSAAYVEQIIYKEILPNLPMSTLTLYGVVDEPGTEFRWFFLEDADGEEFSYSLKEHRRLAARWLAEMHVSAARVPAVSRLPDRGPQYYLKHLLFGRYMIESNLGDPTLGPHDIQVLRTILAQGYSLEAQWNQIEQLCCRYPRTLVHCDFSYQNLRIRSNAFGVNPVAFDWEMAGYGVPAPDVAEVSGRGVPRRRINGDLADSELVDYWSVVRQSWSDLDIAAIKELAELGAVFRSILAISWESESIGRGRWPTEELRGFHADLAVAIEHLGFAG